MTTVFRRSFAMSCLFLLVATTSSQAVTRTLSLSVSATKFYGNADYGFGGDPHRFRYIQFPATGMSGLTTDFALPHDYQPGSPVNVRFVTNSLSAVCFMALRATVVYESPLASTPGLVQFPDGAPPDYEPEWIARDNELQIFRVTITANPAVPFLAGDAISIALKRRGDNINDTCPIALLMSGISAEIEIS